MRIVMLTNAVAPDKLGGLERYVREQASALQALGHEVAVVAKRVADQDPLREVAEDGVVTVRYRAPSKRNPLFVLLYPIAVGADVARALRGLRTSGTDTVINVHHPVPAIVPMVLRLPYVYTFHAPVWREILPERHDGYLLPKPLQRVGITAFRALEGLLLRRARLVVTLSAFIRDEALALGVDAARHRLVAGGLDTDRFTPGPSASTAAGGPVLFTARRMVDRTGVDQLVEAMPAVLERLPEARLRVAGAGARRERIEGLISRLGLTDRVLLLGRIPDAQLVEEYRAADIAVTPTQELEGFGLSTAEALATGTAALVTPVGANPEVVQGLSPLLVARSASPDGIAEAVVRLAQDDETLARVRAGARRHVHPALGWPAVAARYEALYEEASR